MESRKPAEVVKDVVDAAAEKVSDAADPGGARRAGQRPADRRGADDAARPAAAQAGAGRAARRVRRPARRPARRPIANGQQGAYLTTVAGGQAARHRPLAEGRAARPDAAPGPPPPREDHPLRPRAHPRAGGARPRRRRARRVHRRTAPPTEVTRAGFLRKGMETPVFVRFSTVAGVAGLGRHRPRHPRLRHEVLHRRGHLRPGRQQHAGLLHPGRASSSPTSSTPASRTRTGRSRRRRARTTRSGTSSRCTPRRSTTPCGTCPTGASRARTGRWRASACTPSASSTRPGRRCWRSSTGSRSWACTRWPGRRRSCSAASTRTSTAATSTTPSRPARTRSGSSGVQVFPDTPERDLRGHRPARPDEDRARRSWRRCSRSGGWCSTGRRRTSSPRPSRSPSTSATCRPGIDVTNDPLLQARLFSYVDTQLTRLGGPNFTQIPINRPHAPVNDMLRDGFHQHAVHAGVAPYRPNSLDGGCPFPAGDAEHAFVDVPVTVAEAPKVRGQPGLLRRPLQPGAAVLAEHVAGRAGAHHPGLHLRAGQVLRAGDQGTPARSAWPTSTRCCARRSPPAWACRRRSRPCRSPTSRPARPCRRSAGSWPADGRKVGIVVDADGDLDGVEQVRRAVFAAGMVPLVIAPHGGTGRRPAGAAHVRHRPVGRVRRAPAGRGAARRRRTRCRPATPRRARRTRPPWTRGCCCWWRSAGGTPRRSAPGATASRVLEQAGVAGTPGVVTAGSGAGALRRCSS